MANEDKGSGPASLPLRATPEDADALCGYLLRKAMGATLQEARAVVNAKHLDVRKVAAMKRWGLLEDGDRLKLTERGRRYAKDDGAQRAVVLLNVVREIGPYRALVERAAHGKEYTLTTTEAGAHWHDHFPGASSTHEETLNQQALSFFSVMAGAGLGTLVLGRHGQSTRFEFVTDAVNRFIADTAEDSLRTAPEAGDAGEVEAGPAPARSTPSASTNSPAKSAGAKNSIFVGHGKNKAPLQQLEAILNEYKIPHKVATAEANRARPVSEKVAQVMEECGAAILIFTADEAFTDEEGKPVFRPSENVIYELGAASVLYGKRIILLKESSVVFPSNFKDVTYISFEKDQLTAKTLEIFRDLAAMGVLKFSVAT
jgi:predicted nucleotide-binding protein